ncbi:MAG: transcription antitermination factor NusB, partial [Nocardioides sp.]
MADAARLAAYEVLRAVRADDAYANLALAQVLRDRRLTGRDAAFVTELAAGTLRGQGTYDAVIDACLDRGKVQPRVRD